MRRIAVLLLILVALIAGATPWSLRGDRAAARIDPAPGATPLDATPTTVPEGSARRTAQLAPGAEAESDCAFFQSWRSRPVESASAMELFASIGPLGEAPLECLSEPWLLAGLALACEGRLELASEEWERLAAEVRARLDEEEGAEELLQGLRGIASAPTGAIACVLEAVFSPAVPQEERARLLGRWVVALFGGRGHFEQPDEEVVRLLQQMMASWPITEDAWWQGLWSGISERDDFSAVNVRVALYEALHGVLPEGSWVLRLQHLASLEDAQGTFGSFSLMTLGFCLQRHLSEQYYLSLMGQPASDAWRVGLMLVFPQELGWPGARHAEVPEAAIRALVEMRDSGSLQSHLNVLQYQWRILGPEHAVADLERFVLHTAPSEDSGWITEASYQIQGAVEALCAPGVPKADRPTLDLAGTLVRDFFVSAPPARAAEVLESLRKTHWNNLDTGRQRLLRNALVEVLGDEALALLRPELAEWLRS